MSSSKEILEDSAIQRWLSNYPSNYRMCKLTLYVDFHRFLQLDKRFNRLTPSDLINRQKENMKKDDGYQILDLLQEYIRGKQGTYKSLRARYATVKGFFKRNRAALPQDEFTIQANRDPTRERLTKDVIHTLVENSKAGLKAFYLTLWMGILDLERFHIFNEEYGSSLARHLEEFGSKQPFLIEFAGRKSSRGKTRFYTFIGFDALEAWKKYFELLRGYPKEGEAILLDRSGKGYRKYMLFTHHLRLLERLNIIKRGGSSSIRYGYNLHEFRDVARTLLHLEGRKDNLDTDCVEFWMGHVTDPNRYDKFYMDKAYMLTQYKIAEKYLNIMSGGETQRGGVDSMISSKDELVKLAKALENYGFILAKKTA